MAWFRLSRRAFLAALGAAGVGTLVGCGGGGGVDPQPVASTKMFRRSTKNKRSSKAADTHAANRLYPTAAAAAADPAHPGDHADVVPIDTTPAQWDAYFGGGAMVVDLRRL